MKMSKKKKEKQKLNSKKLSKLMKRNIEYLKKKLKLEELLKNQIE